MDDKVEFVFEDDNEEEDEPEGEVEKKKKTKKVRFGGSCAIPSKAPQADTKHKKTTKRSRKDDSDDDEEESESEEEEEEERPAKTKHRKRSSSDADEKPAKSKKRASDSDGEPSAKTKKAKKTKTPPETKKKRKEESESEEEDEEEKPKKSTKKAKPKASEDTDSTSKKKSKKPDEAPTKPTAAEKRKLLRDSVRSVELPSDKTYQERNVYRAGLPFPDGKAIAPLGLGVLGADKTIYYLHAKRDGPDDKPTTSISYVTPEDGVHPVGPDNATLGLSNLLGGGLGSGAGMVPAPEPGTIAGAAAEVARALTKADEIGPLFPPVRIDVLDIHEGDDARAVDFATGWTKLSLPSKRNFNIRCLLYTGDDPAAPSTRIEVLIPTPEMLDQYNTCVVPARAFVQVSRGMRIRIQGAPRRMCLCFVVTSHLKGLRQRLGAQLLSPTENDTPTLRFEPPKPPKPRTPKPALPTETVEEQMVRENEAAAATTTNTGYSSVPPLPDPEPMETEVVAADGPETFFAELDADLNRDGVLEGKTGVFAPPSMPKDGVTKPCAFYGAKVVFDANDATKSTAALVDEVVPEVMHLTGAYKAGRDRFQHARDSKLADGTDVSYRLLHWQVDTKGAIINVWGVVAARRTGPTSLTVVFMNNCQPNNKPEKLKPLKDKWAPKDKTCSPHDYPVPQPDMVRKSELSAKIEELLRA